MRESTQSAAASSRVLALTKSPPKKTHKPCPNMRAHTGARLNILAEHRGLEFIVRFAFCLTIHRQPLSAIARNFEAAERMLEKARAAFFDKHTSPEGTVWILKPEARRQLDLMEDLHRRQYDEARTAEQRIRDALTQTPNHDPIDALGLTPHNAQALKGIRAKLGPVSWVNFLAMIYNPHTPTQVIFGAFPKVLSGPHDAVTWRKVLTNPRRGEMRVEEQIREVNHD